MGEYADYILNGDDCEQCGAYLGGGEGFTRMCASCRKTSADPLPNEKIACPKCKKRVKAVGLKDHMRDAHGIKQPGGKP